MDGIKYVAKPNHWITTTRVYGFGGLERWNGMVEWNGLDWTGLEWNGRMQFCN